MKNPDTKATLGVQDKDEQNKNRENLRPGTRNKKAIPITLVLLIQSCEFNSLHDAVYSIKHYVCHQRPVGCLSYPPRNPVSR